MRRLIVVVPAIRFGFHGWRPLLSRLEAEPELAGSQWVLWDHQKRWYSLASAAKLAVALRAKIDQEWTARGPFDDVILVGYSLGAMLIRQAFLLGAGADISINRQSEWTAKVSRLILIAGVNRGVDPARRVWTRFVSWCVRMFPPFRRVLAWDLLRGSDFVSNLRIQWIRYFNRLGNTAPTVVQLLGTNDTLVSTNDSIDVEQFPNGSYIQIPDADHNTLHRLDLSPDPDGRYALFRDAFVHRVPTLATKRRFTGSPYVVFVLHGIRANNKTWVQEIVANISERHPDIKVIAAQYRYTSALRFAIPMTRQRNLQWFQDAYTEVLARNPRARFGFIGHSNGTYLFGESLRRLPGMQFDRAVLVGTVLPTDYPWKSCFERRQLNALRVDGSSHDWPVGWLCSCLRAIGMRDIGTAGYEGFTDFHDSAKVEHFWYTGGHGAPLASTNLAALAEFAVSGTDINLTALRGEARWFSRVSRAFRWAAPVVAIAVLLGLSWLVYNQPTVAGFVGAVALAVIIIADIT